MLQIAQELGALAQRADRRRVLIVESDPESMQTLRGTLAQAGFAVTTLKKGEDALAVIDRDRPHLVMLDWEYPGLVATNLIQHIRHTEPRGARVMALSLYSSEQQIVSGFELGLDDYVVRPYSLPVIAARVRAILRSSGPEPTESDVLEFHRLRMDLRDQRVVVEGHILPLRPMEFRLLEFLMQHPERVFTREQMLQRIWAGDARAAERAVDVHVQRARRALARHGCGNYLQTVRAVGYRLSAHVA